MASQCSWEQQVEVPTWGPDRGRPGGALLVSPVPEENCLCLPERKARGKLRRQTLAWSHPASSPLKGACYVPGDLPVLIFYSRQSHQRQCR